MNYNNNNLSSRMTEKNSNRISLFIAIIAIILILGGVYMLNKSFSTTSSASVSTLTKQQAKSATTSKTDTSKANKAAPSVTSTDTSVTGSGASSSGDPKTSTSTTSSDTSITKTDSTNTSATTNNIQKTPPPATNTTTTDKKPEVQDTTKSPKAEPLAENEIIATYLGLNSAGQARFEIQECGNTKSTLCKNPNKFSINNTSSYNVELTEGGKYKFNANYSEDASFMLFNSIDSISPVN